MVDHAVFLFEGAVMLLVHHHQAKLGERQPECRARADDDPHAAGCHGAPGLAPLALAEFRLPHRRRGAEARAEAFQPLCAEGNLRQHHQHLAFRLQGRRHGLEINLRLA